MTQNIDWTAAAEALDTNGWAVLPRLLAPPACDQLAALYDRPDHFRSHVIMARHGFGRGEYRYFAYPLPDPVQDLRTRLYPPLADIANRWHERMGVERHGAAEVRQHDLADGAGPDAPGHPSDLAGEAARPLARGEIPRRSPCRTAATPRDEKTG